MALSSPLDWASSTCLVSDPFGPGDPVLLDWMALPAVTGNLYAALRGHHPTERPR